MLKVQNLSFSYYKKPLCLKNINLEIKQGSKNLLVASAEMGKTTFLKVLSSFETHYFGKILLNNKNLKDIDDKGKNFSLVLDKPVFLENKSIKQNFDYFCEIYDKPLYSENEINSFLAEIKISQDLSVKINKLTQFEKKKLAIKRAMLKRPTILFLDDQFFGLSEEEQNKMTAIYEKLLTDKSLTIVFALGEVGIKNIQYAQNFKINNLFYLCDANIKNYASINEFLDKKDNFDVFKFLDGYLSYAVNLIFNDDKLLLEYNGETYPIDEKLLKNAKLDDDTECLLIMKDDKKDDISAKILVEHLKNKQANLYDRLGGNKLI